MALTPLRSFAPVLALILVFPSPSSAFDTPLSDTAVRRAYFMGQRHDESLARFLDPYTKHLPPPKTGPYISSISFQTPYALLAQFSSWQPCGYSAQQAELDHRCQLETVKIQVLIQLTNTYAAVIRNLSSRTTGNPTEYVPRPTDFWRDFQIQVFNEEQQKPWPYFSYSGEPNYICSESGCILVGATIQIEFRADSFSVDSATLHIDPPEGDQVVVTFDLNSIR